MEKIEWFLNQIVDIEQYNKAKFIEDKIKECWITDDNIMDYWMDIIKKQNNWWQDNYKIYKKQFIMEFNI